MLACIPNCENAPWLNCVSKIILVCVLFPIALSACTPSAESLTEDGIRKKIEEDRASIYQHGAAPGEKLTLEDVLARALKYNLDTRVAELDALIAANDVSLERLNTLPTITANKQRVTRNNRGGSSSLSLLTGQQSLQPSISTDQHRNLYQISAEFDVLEAGINIGRARSASDRSRIAQERRRKVYHNVLQDAYSAYWRVAVAQMALPVIDTLMTETKEQRARIDDQIKQGIVILGEAQGAKAELQNRRQQLSGMRQSLLLAETELKTLIDYPLDQPLVLDLGDHNWLRGGKLPTVKETLSTLEDTAFINRPEVREEILNKNISARDIKLTFAETLPGMSALLTYNYDSNSFLADRHWLDSVFSVTQAINKVLTLPARFERAENVDKLADRRRQALAAAIITQVHVAKARCERDLQSPRGASFVRGRWS